MFFEISEPEVRWDQVLALDPPGATVSPFPLSAFKLPLWFLERWQEWGSAGQRGFLVYGRGFSDGAGLKTLSWSWNEAKNQKDRWPQGPSARRYNIDGYALVPGSNFQILVFASLRLCVMFHFPLFSWMLVVPVLRFLRLFAAPSCSGSTFRSPNSDFASRTGNWTAKKTGCFGTEMVRFWVLYQALTQTDRNWRSDFPNPCRLRWQGCKNLNSGGWNCPELSVVGAGSERRGQVREPEPRMCVDRGKLKLYPLKI